MKILLDTNFILTSVKQKLDFFRLADELFDEELEWIVPVEVLEELKKLSKRKGEKTKDRQAAQTALEILKKHKTEKIKLKNQNVDKGLGNYVKKHKIVLATLDKELKKQINTGVLTICGKKNLKII